MIDCTKTENFLKELRRMCYHSPEGCKSCGLSNDNNGKGLVCGDFCEEYSVDAIAIVQKWSDEHSQKTMLDKFKEDHPNAPMTNEDIPKACPCNLGYDKFADCPKNAKGFYIKCVKCWNRPYEEEQK